jgi:hypothetical protein
MNARSILLAAATLLAASVAPATLGCGGGGPPPVEPWKTPAGARWQDVFVTPPDMLLMVHPAQLGRDPVYGPVVKSALRVALQRSAHVASYGMLEAVQSAEMVVVGKSGDSEAVDGVVVLRGVRADLDPARIAGEGGPLWHALPPQGSASVPEYTNASSDASLFDLGERTWVVAAGAHRQEARQVFAHPFGRPLPFEEDGALALLRIRGETMLSIAPRLRNGDLSPVGKHLAAASLELRPGGEGALLAAFVYRDDEAATFAETTLRDVAHALSTPGDGKPPWIGSAEVSQQARTVTVKATIAERLLQTMKRVGAR